jgi:formylglycine-generating enzyme required for sulfatase activity
MATRVETEQEAILVDLKQAFAADPLRLVHRPSDYVIIDETAPMRWHVYDETNEPFKLASRPVTNGEYLAFIQEGGYERQELWLPEGWQAVFRNDWTAPFYWEKIGGKWWTMTLSGLRETEKSEPVCHVSWYEAEAFARWWGRRLPTGAEWETAARHAEIDGNFSDNGLFHPVPLIEPPYPLENPSQLFGDVWEWTADKTLRGGSCATPAASVSAATALHVSPESRLQFSGIRLAEDA